MILDVLKVSSDSFVIIGIFQIFVKDFLINGDSKKDIQRKIL